MPYNGPPNFEEFQKQMADFMRHQFQPSSTTPTTDSDSSGDATDPSPTEEDDSFDFDLIPRDVKAHLDRFVIRQETAKRVLSVALCDHYNHVKLAQQGKSQSNYAKQNIILVGPTGVGKTYLIKSIADLIGVPFVKGDATKFSETGYVGADVEDLVRELVRRADGDIEKAQYGIIYVDEIDKIATSTNQQGGRDVSGRGVQTNLLKLMEETEISARSPNDIAGQIQSMMDFQRKKKPAGNTINTKHILFIVSGAFDGLNKIVEKRLRESTIGFAAQPSDGKINEEMLENAQTRDFIDFGFEPEFIGRLPVRVVCHSLVANDLFQIMKTSEGSLIRQYEEAFGAYGLQVLFENAGLQSIANRAAEEKTGARGLMTVCERVFRDYKFELPGSHVKRFSVTSELEEHPRKTLDALLHEQEEEEKCILRSIVNEFAQRFHESHGLKIRFEDAAADYLIELAAEQGRQVRVLCSERFKDFHFGLKLIAQNMGTEEFVINRAIAEDPEKKLSEWVVESYRGKD